MRACAQSSAPRCAAGPCPPRLAARAPSPLSWLSSVPVGRRTSHAPHHGCDEGEQPAPCVRSSARVEETSGAGAPSSAVRSQKQGRVQHKSHPLGFESSRSHKQGNACLSHTPGGVGGVGCVGGGGGADITLRPTCLSISTQGKSQHRKGALDDQQLSRAQKSRGKPDTRRPTWTE